MDESMEGPAIEEAFRTLASELARAAADRVEVRNAVETVLRWIARLGEAEARLRQEAAADKAAPARSVERVLHIGDVMQRVLVEDDGTPEAPRAEPITTRGRDSEDAPWFVEPPTVDLDLVIKRTRVKADACRWAVTRRRRVEEGADHQTAIRPMDAELTARAKALVDCFVWPMDAYRLLPDDAMLEQIASCYENVAAAVELAREIHGESDHADDFREDTYVLMAEAQSALRAGLLASEVKRDADQEAAFNWLKRRTSEDRIYVERHMRIDDPADPAASLDLSDRIAALRDRFQSIKSADQKRQQALNKIRYHAMAIQKEPEGREHDWDRLREAINRLLDLRVQPSDAGLREIILPIVELMPDGVQWEPPADRVLVEIDRYLAGREATQREDDDGQLTRARSQDVIAAAALLRGKGVVLIGGQRRPLAERALKEALELGSLTWNSSSPHESLSTFEPSIARADTSLVLLAIRWSSHSYEGVKGLCARYDKAFVRLPGGYNPAQVARQILSQASDRLR